MLTGLLEQWRALNPDGTLLADGYRRAGEGERMTLLRALTDSGDLDVLHRAARARAAPLFESQDEAQYLTRRYADRGDQAGLRELVTSLSPSGAILVAFNVNLAAILGGPGDDGLLTLLARINPGAVRRAWDEIRRARPATSCTPSRNWISRRRRGGTRTSSRRAAAPAVER